jgi:flavin reductase
MSELRQNFLEAMSRTASTVNIVATDGPAGMHGLTVTAMSSVSADTEKPVLLVCINARSAGAAAIIANGAFSVNILRDNQALLSDTFAGRLGDKGNEKFSRLTWNRGKYGTPVLKTALVGFECRLVDDQKIGQHHIFFGEVQQIELGDRGNALIHTNRAYATPAALEELELAA